MLEEHTRKRLNSRLQGAGPVPAVAVAPRWRRQKLSQQIHKRRQVELYVTLVPLNETFVKKTVHVPYWPETCKLGRPTGTKLKPQPLNGYFDLRVLLRNHACLFVDSKTGAVMIQDMGSLNGTFVNQEKLGLEPVPLHIGDTVNLGFNIQETSHRQILARVSDINVVANAPSAPLLAGMPRLSADVMARMGSVDRKHLDFIQAVLELLQPQTTESGAQPRFEEAMFADQVPLADDFVNSAPENAGIFANANLVPLLDVEASVDLLLVNVARARQQSLALQALHSFFTNYAKNAAEINASVVQRELLSEKAEHQLALHKERAEHDIVVHRLQLEVLRLEAERIVSRKNSDSRPKLRPGKLENVLLFSEPKSDSSEVSAAEASEISEPKELNNVVHSVEKSAENNVEKPPTPKQDSPAPEVSHTPENTLEKMLWQDRSVNPYLRHLQEQLQNYRNQGIVAGLVVVVAGFVYQSAKTQ